MTEKNQTTGSTGTGTGTGTSTRHSIQDHVGQIKNSTDYLNDFRLFVQGASKLGVTQQQLLDYVSDSYMPGKN